MTSKRLSGLSEHLTFTPQSKMPFSKAILFGGVLCLFSGTLSGAAESYDTYIDHATSTANLLIDNYYSEDNGQFDDLWWNSAITFIELGDLSGILDDNGAVGNYDLYDMYENVYAKHTADGSENEDFLNPYYDDEGWWALNWINAYDLTGDGKYLDMAESITADMYDNGQACGGGIWWSKDEDVLTTIENVLLMGVAAHLANRVDGDKQKYIDMAEESWAWLQNSGSWDPDGYTIGGNVDSDSCQSNDSNAPSSYSQGVLVGALLELATAEENGGYVDLAKNVAQATMTYGDFLTDDGIFQTPLGGFSNDTAQFMGIFLRYLMILQRQYPDDSYVDFATRNADSIWNNARNEDGTIIARWQGNPDGSDLGDYSLEVTTCSGNQALIAAADMVKG